MPSDDDKSLGDEATFQGSVKQPFKEEQSLGDRSTFHGGDASSISDLGGFADATDHDMEIVDLSGRYKIEETLGQGGMGEVLLATDTRLDRKVAIKRIRGDAGASKAAVARFLTEAKSIAALNHPNVVHVYDYGRDESGPFLIMEYVAGGSLLERCKQGPMELEEAVELACQLCDGLGRAHDAGIVHRDIKPANILLTHDGVPKLTDFGLAKADSRDHTMTMAGAVLGTLDFMPPEQRRDASLADARSDLWSLAATLYQMVTGESPRHIKSKLIPEPLLDGIERALEKEKADRYQTAKEFRDALEKRSNRTSGTQRLPSHASIAGECSVCGIVNDITRKFCRNVSCRSSLTSTCFSCQSCLPVWETVCGECGCNQQDSVVQLVALRNELRMKASAQLDKCKFSEAERLRVELSEEKDPRLQQLNGWIDSFANEIQRKKKKETKRLRTLLDDAISLEAKGDFVAAIERLRVIPEHLRQFPIGDDPVVIQDTLTRLEQAREEISALTTEIITQATEGNFHGLLPKIDRVVALDPRNRDVLELRPIVTAEIAKRGKLLSALEKQTKESHDRIHQRAKKFLAEGNLKAAETEAWAFDSKFLSAEQTKIKERIESGCLHEKKLLDAFDEFFANAGDAVNQDLQKAQSLKTNADSFLNEIPGHKLIRQKTEELQECIASIVAAKDHLFRKAIDAYDRQAYEECIELIRSIPVDASDSSPSELKSLASQNLEKLNTLASEIESNLNRGILEEARQLIHKALALQANNERIIELAETESKVSDRKYQTMLQQAAGLQKTYLFDEAIRICEFLSQIKDTRYEKYQSESMQLKEQILAEEQYWRDEQQKRLLDALELRRIFKYKAAIERLDGVPKPVRSEDCENLLKEIKSDHKRSRGLFDEIKNRVKSGRTKELKDISDLLELIDNALRVMGDREDLTKMRQQLNERLQKSQVDSIKFERDLFKIELARFRCPNCDEKLHERLELLKRQDNCPACGSRFYLTDRCWRSVLARRQ